MKKALSILTMLVIVFACVTAGTFAVYSVKNESSDSKLTAHEFKMTTTGFNSFDADVKLAPTMSKSYEFTVSNFSGDIISGTDMDIAVTVRLTTPTNYEAIKPLTAVLNKTVDGTPQSVGTSTITDGVGDITFTEVFAKDARASSSFTVTITWPSTDNDIDYAGAGFGTSLKVIVVATQKV